MEATQRIRIAVADDSTIYRNNVRLMLRLQNDMAVVAEAENGWSAIEQVKAHRPDILLIDIRMPFGGMSAYEECDYDKKMRKSGAWGYLDNACF